MFNDTSATNATATYVKVPAYPGLYRHSRSGRYYGFKKLNGKRYECSLRTTDRRIAERRFREWVANLVRVDREKERTTFAQLIHTFIATNRGKSKSTQTTHRSIIKRLHQTWRLGLDVEVRLFQKVGMLRFETDGRIGATIMKRLVAIAAILLVACWTLRKSQSLFARFLQFDPAVIIIYYVKHAAIAAGTQRPENRRPTSL